MTAALHTLSISILLYDINILRSTERIFVRLNHVLKWSWYEWLLDGLGWILTLLTQELGFLLYSILFLIRTSQPRACNNEGLTRRKMDPKDHFGTIRSPSDPFLAIPRISAPIASTMRLRDNCSLASVCDRQLLGHETRRSQVFST